MTIKDKLGREVNPGDAVVLLVKDYGYRKIKDAHLHICTYRGKGQYGYEFREGHILRIVLRNPELVKI